MHQSAKWVVFVVALACITLWHAAELIARSSTPKTDRAMPDHLFYEQTLDTAASIVFSAVRTSVAPPPSVSVVAPVADRSWASRQKRIRDNKLMRGGDVEPPARSDNAVVTDTDGDPLHLSVAIMTTLKNCSRKETYDSQLAAITTWAMLPLIPRPHVVILGNDPCGYDIARHVNNLLAPLRAGEHNISIMKSPKIMGPHGTVLLGPAIAAVAHARPQAQVYALINADILLHPSAAYALHRARQRYLQFFLVGRRTNIDMSAEVRASLDFGSTAWVHHPVFLNTSNQDRVDAEDYFFWSNRFFADKQVEIPPFHVGRPAYDNWFVHTAIHTFQPVIDASDLILAYHQRHDYSHLANKSYWGGKEQNENYELALQHGGWQHGLIDFIALRFEPACAYMAKTLSLDAFLRHPERCKIIFKPEWEPLSNGRYGDLQYYQAKYNKAVRFGNKQKS